VNPAPLYAGSATSLLFTDKTADLSQANAAARAFVYEVSPEYFHAAVLPCSPEEDSPGIRRKKVCEIVRNLQFEVHEYSFANFRAILSPDKPRSV
jgi:hypothetical protein